MTLKLFTPQESRNQNSAQNVRDALRTREIKKLLEKGHTELAKHEADFADMIARHKEKWAKEEEAHAIRMSEMEREVRSLEERRKTALIPIALEKQRADTMIADAEKRLGEVEKRERESESLKDVLLERIEQVSERETAVKDEEEKIVKMRADAEHEKETAKANTKNLSESIEKFNTYVASETLILDGKRTEITLKERSIEARTETLDRKERSLSVREAQLKDKQDTLTRAFDEYRRKTMSENTEEKVEVTPEAPVESAPETATETPSADATAYEGPMGTYKITGEAFYTDEHGNRQGTLDIGSIQKLPTPVGEVFVKEGVAEEVIETAPEAPAEVATGEVNAE